MTSDTLSHIHRRVGRTVEEILQDADTLRGLATSLEALADLTVTADHQRLRETATALRSFGVQGLLSAGQALALSERLCTLAGIREVNSTDALRQSLAPGNALTTEAPRPDPRSARGDNKPATGMVARRPL